MSIAFAAMMALNNTGVVNAGELNNFDNNDDYSVKDALESGGGVDVNDEVASEGAIQQEEADIPEDEVFGEAADNISSDTNTETPTVEISTEMTTEVNNNTGVYAPVVNTDISVEDTVASGVSLIKDEVATGDSVVISDVVVSTSAVALNSGLTVVAGEGGNIYISGTIVTGCDPEIVSVTIPDYVTEIGEVAFSGSALESITFAGDQVRIIGEAAFESCYMLKEIVLPVGLKTISYSAFAGCSALESIDIPASVSTIAEYAFADCMELKTLNFRPKECTIDSSAFEGTGVSDFTGNNGFTLYCYQNSTIDLFTGELNYSEKIYYTDSGDTDGYPEVNGRIKYPVDNGYIYIDKNSGLIVDYEGEVINLTNLPSSVNTIVITGVAADAFKGCTTLEEVSCTSSMTSIGASAFENCINLKKVTLPEGLQSIEAKSFSGCTNLTSVGIPSTLKVIGDEAFYNTSSLTSIDLYAEITEIGARAFYGSHLRNVELPTTLTKLGESAFESCTNLYSVSVPGALTEIGDNVFRYCSSLEEIELETGLTSLGINMFMGTAVKNVELPDTLTEIDSGVFAGCTNLESVLVNGNLTNVASDAFMGSDNFQYVLCYKDSSSATVDYNKDNLIFVYLDDVPNDISGWVFDYETYKKNLADAGRTLPEIIDSESRAYWYWLSNDLKNGTNASIVLDFDYYRQNNNDDKELAALGTDYEKIFEHFVATNKTNKGALSENYWGMVYQERYADLAGKDGDELVYHYLFEGRFEGRTAGLDSGMFDEDGYYLYEVTSADENKSYLHIDVDDGYVVSADKNVKSVDLLPSTILGQEITRIGEEAFIHCESLTSVTLTSTVTRIDENAFAGCTLLSNIVMPGVTYIGTKAFENNLNLVSVELPEVVEVADYAFYKCENLEEIIMPKMQIINDHAFDTTAVSLWDLPETVTKIGTGAFSNKLGYGVVLMPQSATDISDLPVANGIVVVYQGSVADMDYMPTITKYYRDTFMVYPVDGGNIYIAGNEVIASDANVVGVDIPSRVGSRVIYRVAPSVFYNKADLDYVSIEEGVIELGDYAFRDSAKISEVELPSTLTSIGAGVFSGCTSLTTINLQYVQNFGETSFENTGLTILELSEDTKTISDNAFKDNQLLERVIILSTNAEISASAFSNCNSLTVYCYEKSTADNISLYPSGSKIVYLHEGHVYAVEGGNIYYDDAGYIIDADTTITRADIPTEINGITIVGVKEYAFESCSALTSISFGDALVDIQEGAFADCTSLKSLDLPVDTVKTIGAGAFRGCSSLTSFTVPDNVGAIEADTFRGCTSLSSVTLPKTVVTIGDRAFYGCDSLKSLTIYRTVSEMGSNIFTPRTEDNQLTIYCYVNTTADKYTYPENVIKSYLALEEIAVDGGNIYVDAETGMIVDADDTVTQVLLPYNEDDVIISGIDSYAFDGCTQLTLCVLPMTATSLASYAFNGCSNLQYMSLPAVQTIGNYAFNGCSKLYKINMPNTVGGTAADGSSNIKEDFLAGSGVGEISCNTNSYFYANASTLAPGIKIDGRNNTTETPISGMAEYIFDVKYYIVNNKDLIANIGCNPEILYTHLLEFGLNENRNAMYMFDRDTYYKYNPEVEAEFGTDYREAFEYFIQTDYMDKVVSSLEYSGDAYQSRYSDLEGMSAEELIKHYVETGRAEGRDASPFGVDENGYVIYPVEGGNIYINLKEGLVVSADTTITGANIPSKLYGYDITTINSGAFESCSVLSTITLNADTTILSYAFLDCTNLKEINLEYATFIGESAFRNTGLTEIYIGSQAEIQQYAFADCINLGDIAIDSPAIGDYAFSGCTSLESADLTGVKTIGTGAFDGCSTLSDINMPIVEVLGDAFNGVEKKIWYLPDTIKSVASSTFDADSRVRMPNTADTEIASDFMDSGKVFVYSNSSADKVDYIPEIEKIVADGELIIYAVENGYIYISDGVVIDSDDTVTAAEIPESVEGTTITAIGDSAFAYNDNLTKVVLPETVKTLGTTAFAGCSNLNYIDLGGVTSVGAKQEFDMCIGLETVKMDKMIVIENLAFAGAKCKVWNLPASVRKIGNSAFPNGSKVYIPQYATNVSGSLMTNGTVIVYRGSYADTDVQYVSGITKRYTDGLIAYPVENGYIYIDEETGYVADADSTIYSADIPTEVEGITVSGIGESAFAGCRNLTSITIPETVTEIEAYGLSFTGLTEITLPETLTSIGAYALSENKFTELTIPASVTSIGNNAFGSCTNLKKITVLSPSVKLGENLFEVMNGALTDLEVHLYRFSTMDDYSYSEVDSYTKVYLDSGLYDEYGYYMYKVDGGYLHIDLENGMVMFADDLVYGAVLPETVNNFKITSIADEAFKDHAYFQYVNMPYITDIGTSAFENCSALVSVDFNKIASVSDKAFYGCRQLTTVNMPNVTYIGASSFNTCTSLVSVSFPRLTAIGARGVITDAFYGCSKLSEFDAPVLKLIGQGTFFNCSSLKQIELPNVEFIGYYAFYHSGLTSLTLPESVTHIYGASIETSSLTELTIKSRDADIHSNAIKSSSNLKTAYVYRGSTADNASLYPTNTEIVYLDKEVGVSGEYDYDENGYLKYPVENGYVYINISNGEIVKADTSITAVTLPDIIIDTAKDISVTVRSIGAKAFYNCTKLVSVTLCESIIDIDDYAFQSCTVLSEITGLDGVTSIGKYAFTSCINLKSIELLNVTSIGDYAFYQATALTSVEMPKVVTIGGNAFRNTSLEEVELPETVSGIGAKAFYSLKTLHKLTVYSKDVVYTSDSVQGTGITDIYLYKNSTTDTYDKFPTNAVKHYLEDDTTLEGSYDENGYYLYRVENGYLHIDLEEGLVVYADNTVTGAAVPDEINGYSIKTIGESAFSRCASNLTWVTFEEGISQINEEAFSGCSELSGELNLESIRYIGGSAFSGVSSVDTIVLGDRLTFIGSNAFEDITVDTLTIPQSVSAIGSYAFANASVNTLYILSKNTSIEKDTFIQMVNLGTVYCYRNSTADNASLYPSGTVIEYLDEAIDEDGYYKYAVEGGFLHIDLGTGTVVYADDTVTGAVIPDEIQGKEIRTIAQNAFNGNIRVTYVTMDYITIIDSSAFSGCTNLSTVSMQSVTSLGMNAFNRCTSLTSVDLPSATTIGTYALRYCSNLQTVNLPVAKTIGNAAFGDCISLVSVDLPEVTNIVSWAFANCTGLESVNMPKVTSIGSYVFYGDTALKTLDLPESLTSIGSYSVYNNPDLETVYIRNKDMVINSSNFGTTTGIKTVYCYKGSTADDASIYPNGTEIIYLDGSVEDGLYMYAVEGGYIYIDLETGTVVKADDTITSVTIPDVVEDVEVVAVGKGALKNKTALTYLDLGNVTTLEYEAVRGCTKLSKIIGNNVITVGDKAFRGNTKLEEVTLPLVETIGEWAFADTTALRKINLPSVISLDNYAFYKSGIEDVDMLNATTLGASVFSNCRNLNYITLENVTTVGYQLFDNSTNLLTVDMPKLTAISVRMFNNCTSLEQVDMDSITEIPEAAFDDCDILFRIYAPNVTAIGNNAFDGCVDLYDVDFGENVKSIGNEAFVECRSLTDLGFPNATAIGSKAFYNCVSLQSINVPLVFDLGEKAFEYTALTSISMPNLTEIPEAAFHGCDSLVSAEFSPELSIIADDAFDLCENLTDFSDTSNVIEIGYSAFAYNYKLKDLDLSLVETIGANAFQYCTALKELNLLNVTSIGDKAFNYCSALRDVTIETRDTVIDDTVFNNCNALNVYCYKDSTADNISLYPSGSKINYLDDSYSEEGYYKYAVEGGYLYIDLQTGTVVGADDTVTSAVVPSRVLETNVVAIGKQAFLSNKNLTFIDLGDVTSVGYEAFRECTNLETVIGNKVEIIDGKAFREDTKLSSITLPVVTVIGEYAFNGAASLTSIDLPALTTLEDNAFAKSGLKEISLPNVISVGNSVFSYCTQLQSVDMPKVTSFGYNMFNYCSSLVTVNAPLLITISSQTFNHCENLVTVNAPLVQDIQANAFDNCYLLADVNFGDKVEYIGADAFVECHSLTGLNLPLVTELRAKTFYGCTSLTNIEVPNVTALFGGQVFGLCSALTSISMPKVTKIPDAAFANCSSLVSAEFSPELSSIGEDAFDNCGNLSSFSNTSNVKEIGYSAFAYNTKLPNLDLSSVEVIGEKAFQYCQSMTELSLPNIKEIGLNAFNQCIALNKVTIESMEVAFGSLPFYQCRPLTVYCHRDSSADNLGLYPSGSTLIYFEDDYDEEGYYKYAVEGGYLYIDLETGTVVKADDTVTKAIVPDKVLETNVVAIGEQAFNDNTNLTYVDLGNATIIGYEAFRDCTQLATVIGNEVITVEGKAFRGDSSLSEVVLPKAETLGEWVFGENTSLVNIDLPSLTYIDNNAFNSSGITNISIPKVTYVGDSVFSQCKNLTEISLDSVTDIGYGAFNYASNLTTFIAPKLTYVGSSAFNYCEKLTTVIASNIEVIDSDAFDHCIMLSDIDFGAKVTDLGDRAFDYCKSLRRIDLPVLTYIGVSAFRGCTALASINIPKVDSIGNEAFNGCKALTDVSLPEVKEIGIEAFYNCTNLINIDMPNVVTIGSNSFRHAAIKALDLPKVITIKDEAFYECSDLISVNAPELVTVEDRAFHWSGLQTITMPKVQTIGVEAFNYSQLSSLEAPALKSIGSEAFNHTELTEVVLRNRDIQVGYSAFTGTSTLKTVYCYRGSKADNLSLYPSGVTIIYIDDSYDENGYYKYAVDGGYIYIDLSNGTVMYADATVTNVAIPETIENIPVTHIADGAFKGLSNLVSVDLGNVTTIGYEAFRECPALESVTGNAVTTVDGKAFRYCTSLVDVTFPNATTVGEWTFGDCTSLQTISLPKLTSIGEHVFQYSSVESVSMPELTTLSANAFYECADLNSVYLPKVTEIREKAFGFTDSLVELELPSVIKVGSRAFEKTSIKNLDLSKVTSLGEGAFESSDIVSINIDTVEAIPDSCFNNCFDLQTVLVSNLKSIGFESFKSCNSLGTIDFAHNIISCGKDAFSACDAITEVTFNNLTELADGAFYGCDGLITFVAPELTKIGDDALRGCESLVTVDIPKIEYIGFNAFINSFDKNVGTSITFYSRNVKLMYSFLDDDGPNDGTADTLISYIKEVKCYQGSTADNPRLYPEGTRIVYLEETTDEDGYYLYAVEGGYLHIDLDNGIVVKADDTVTSAVIPETIEGVPITIIGEGAFEGLTNLDWLNPIHAEYITEIRDSAFANCTTCPIITSDRLKYIGNKAFYNTVFEGWFIDFKTSGVEYIGDSAFEGSSTVWVTSLENVKYVGNNAFHNADLELYPEENVHSYILDLPCVTYIGDNAFEISSDIRRIVLGTGIEYIGNNAFASNELTLVSIPSRNVDVSTTVVSASGTGLTVCCYEGSSTDNLSLYPEGTSLYYIDSYENTEGYYELVGTGGSIYIDLSTGTIVGADKSLVDAVVPEEINGVRITTVAEGVFKDNTSLSVLDLSYIETIENGAFEGCTSLLGVYLTDGTTSYLKNIGERAFYNCNALQTLHMDSRTVQTVGDYAFYNVPCGAYVNISSFDSVKSIGEGAFMNTGFKNLSINSDTSIGASAFANIDTLTTLTISDSATLGENVFSGCTALDKVYLSGHDISVASTAFNGTNINMVMCHRGDQADNKALYSTDTQILYYEDNYDEDGYYLYEVDGGYLHVDLATGTVRDADASVKNAEIPEYINGVRITALANNVFSWNTSLKSVVAPYITTIENCFFNFAYCDSLETVYLPSLTGELDMWFMVQCPVIETFILPEGITSVEWATFMGCTSLKTIYVYSKDAQISSLPVVNGSESPVETVYCYRGSTADNADLWGDNVTIKYLSDHYFTTDSGKVYVDDDGYIVNAEPNLTDIVIPETTDDGVAIVGIAEDAFIDCTLNSVMMNKNIIDIEDGAFTNKGQNLTVYLTKGSIADSYAFTEVTGTVEKVYINAVTVGGEVAYAYPVVGGNIYVTADGTVCAADIGVVSADIPGTIYNIDVTTIGDSAFLGHNITNVVLGEGIETIEDNAFGMCYSLTNITLPTTLKSIGDYAFESTAITKIELPSELSSLGDGAFSSSALTKIVIYSKDITIARDTFDGVGALKVECYKGSTADNTSLYPIGSTIVYLDEMEDDEGNYLYEVEGGYLHIDLENGIVVKADDTVTSATIPETIDGYAITIIGDGAFESLPSLTAVNVEYIEEIRDSAFANCSGLDIKTSDRLRYIGNRAFYNTTSPSRFDCEINTSNVEYIGDSAFEMEGNTMSYYMMTQLSNVKYVGSKAFYNTYFALSEGPGGYTTILDLSNVETIGDNAFNPKRSTIYMVMIGSNLKSVGNNAFDFKNMASFSVNASSSSVGNVLVENASKSGLTVYCIEGSSFDNPALYPEGTVIEYIIKLENTEGYYEYAGVNGSIYIDLKTGTVVDADPSLVDVIIPEEINGVKITTIGKEAFKDCTSLQFTDAFYITDIEDSAFEGCTALEYLYLYNTNVSLEGNLRNIGDRAFYGCSNLTVEINLTALETIGDHAFDGTSVSIGASGFNDVKSIGVGAFADSSGYRELVIASDALILDSAFKNSLALTRLTIAGAATLGPNAFSGCARLTTVTISDPNVVIDLTTFSGTDINTVVCHKGSAADNQSLYSPTTKFIYYEDGYDENGYYLYELDGGYAHVNLETGTVMSIDESVENVELPEYINGVRITTLSSGLYWGNSTLKTFNAPYITTVKGYTFMYCYNLESLNLSSLAGVDSSNIIAGCPKLKSFVIPESVTNVPWIFINSCENFETLYIYSKDATISTGAINNGTHDITVYCYKGSTADDPSLWSDGTVIKYLDEE